MGVRTYDRNNPDQPIANHAGSSRNWLTLDPRPAYTTRRDAILNVNIKLSRRSDMYVFESLVEDLARADTVTGGWKKKSARRPGALLCCRGLVSEEREASVPPSATRRRGGSR